MKIEKLFNVLVVGGALLTAAPALAAQTIETLPLSAEGEPLASQLAFCQPENPNHCVVNEEGERVPRAGITCCWGTSCAPAAGEQ